ncbi:putative PurR-regulated permease PerM [Mesonia hippocampi]|uniref:Putative PurR-regulated permease PerM n=1 Tax=Mesonia hippocampi TaxID=1628250 RepID=A0A840EZ02_9FLAO|nr:AI-2E family transporter [Mesonia hippocampi]MBB4120037.1 putative PurR-regulated permease PerM [Mesonia hippocampi]
MKKLSPELVRQLFLLILVLILGLLIFFEMLPYLSGVLGAVTMHILFKGWMSKLVKKGLGESLAASIIIVVSVFIIVIPVTGIILLLSSKISRAVQNFQEVALIIKEQFTELETSFGYSISQSIDTSKITDWVSTNLQSLAGGTFNIVIAIGVMYFILYYLLINRNNLQSSLVGYIPMNQENINIIGKETNETVKANAIGIPLVALCQGIIALIGYLIFGVPDPFFWFVVTTIGSMIPFVGTAIGVIPVTIILLAQGNTWQAIAILIYGIVVVGSTDNIIRLMILKRLSDVHPLVTLIGVIVGVPLFGFIGLIFGPLIISLFMLMVKLYKYEYGKNPKQISLEDVLKNNDE